MRTLSLMFKYFIDILFPIFCKGCGESGTFLCEKCLSLIQRPRELGCRSIVALFDYRDPLVQKAIWQLKYKNMRAVADCFGRELYETILGDISDDLSVSNKKSFLLVPIPLHKKRLWERGYNQSELVAKAIMRHDSTHLFELSTQALVRVRETKPQARSDKRIDRLENLRGAFRANSALVCKKDLVLIDDVTTTGATFSEARKTLLRAGARSVRAYAVAH